MTRTIEELLRDKGGILRPSDLDGAARDHLEDSSRLFEGYLKSVLVSDGLSPLVRSTPPSRVSQFEFVNRWDINACAALADERPLILFHAGVPFSLYELFSSLLSHDEVLGEIFAKSGVSNAVFSAPKLDYTYLKSRSWPSSVPFTAEQIAYSNSLGYGVDPNATTQVLWRAYVEPMPRTEDRRNFLGEAYRLVLHFLFFHELAHIDLGHIELKGRSTNSLELNEIIYGGVSSFKEVTFNSAMLQALETDADRYALKRALDIYLPQSNRNLYSPSIGGFERGNPQCYRLFLFAVGVFFLFIEHQQIAKTMGQKFLKILSKIAPTHPSALLRARFLFQHVEVSLFQAGLDPSTIIEISDKALSDLITAANLLGLDARYLKLNRKQISALITIHQKNIEKIEGLLFECANATRERYYDNGELTSYDDGRINAQDTHHLGGQSVGIRRGDIEINIPFIKDTSPVEAFIENSEKWERAGYLDNAILYALLATQRDPQSNKAANRLAAIRERLGEHIAVFDEMLETYGEVGGLVDDAFRDILSEKDQENPVDVLKKLDACAALRPQDNEYRFKYISQKAEMYGYTSVVGDYKAALAVSETDEERSIALIGLGNAAATNGETDEALALYMQALEIDERNVIALTNIGATLGRAKRAEEGIKYYERALIVSPEDHKIWYSSSYTYFMCNNFEKSREYIRRAIELAPNLAHYKEALAGLSEAPDMKSSTD